MKYYTFIYTRGWKVFGWQIYYATSIRAGQRQLSADIRAPYTIIGVLRTDDAPVEVTQELEVE